MLKHSVKDHWSMNIKRSGILQQLHAAKLMETLHWKRSSEAPLLLDLKTAVLRLVLTL